jgi:bifunctional non-homologous end joining protein LigD
MSQAKSKLQKGKSHSKTPARALKKLPSKSATKKAATNEVVIDLKDTPANFKSIIELAKRKLKHAEQTPMPSDIKPMLATLVDTPFTDVGWQFELKLDGYRSIAYIQKGRAELRSRNNLSFNKKFAQVQTALSKWNIEAVVDGEVVVLDEQGVPDFNGIQQWEKKKSGQLVYYVFDLLWLAGLNIMNEPLHVRREILKQLVPEGGIIRFSDHIDAVGEDFFEIVKNNKLEGIIAKRRDAVYIAGSRSQSWLKIKAEQRHEALVCGYTKKRDTDRLFSSLVLGIYKQRELTFIGQVGTGFSAVTQQDILKKMKPHITKTCPFDVVPPLTDKVMWLKPFLVCEVKYTELTSEGVMRHASFQGLREDKAAFELNTEGTF